MARDFGRVVEDTHRSGRPRWRIDCGVVELGPDRRERVRIPGRPDPDNAARLVPFPSAAAAELELEYLRAAIATYGLVRSITPYLPRDVALDLVETRVEVYLEDFRARVRAGQRSPNTLAELDRYARAGGHWSWWYGKTIRDLSNRDAKDWHAWLATRPAKSRGAKGRTIGAKTQKNVSDAFRAFLFSVRDDENGELYVPRFPPIEVPEYVARTITPERLLAVLEQIPWERRGVYLVMAFEGVRVSEAVAFTLDDWDGRELHIHRGRQGHRVDARVRHNKTRSAKRRAPWWPELVKWLAWRVEQTTAEDRLAGRASALFWCPEARGEARAWSEDALRRQWRAACTAAGESIALQEGTRHTVLSRLAEVLPLVVLQEQSRHRDSRSLAHYTVGARPDPAAMVRAIRRREGE